ncbi:MAG: MFS transporter [archaeon]
MVHTYEDLHKLSNLCGKMQDLYSNLALRIFAFSILSVFLPIYFLSIGMSIEYIIVFFLLLFMSVAVFSPVALVVAQRVGLKNTVIISLPFSIIFFALIYKMGEGFVIPAYVIAFFGGIGEAFYFTAINLDFALNTKKEHRGYNIGALDSFFKSSAVFGPVFGALVIANYGFELVFGFAILLLMLSLIPALQVKVYRESFRYRMNRIFNRGNVRYLFVFFAYGVVSAAEWFLWPLFVFFALSDVMGVALAVALVAVGTGIFVGLFRFVSSNCTVPAFLKVGAIVYAVTWVLRANSSFPVDIYALSFLAGLVIVLVHIPFFADTIERAKEVGVAEFIVFREVAVCMGRIAFFGVMLVAIVYGYPWYVAGFFAATAASLLFLGA